METNKKPPRRRSSIYASKPQPPSDKAGNFSTRFSLNAFVKRVEKLTQSQKDAIIKTGFGNLLVIGNHMISKNFLVELMERWHPQKQAFLLKGNIFRITKLDVALILGLRVTGEAVNIVRESDLPFVELEKRYGADLWKRKITLGSIEKRLEDLGENDDHDFVRSFLLFTFGTILFPNSTLKVDSRYLFFLQDLDSVGKFDWGSAVLEHLVNWLSKRKEINVEYVGGCLILLQIWSYEHVNIARPSSRNHHIKFPRACRWDNSKSHQRNWFAQQFRNLQNDQMSWNLDLTSEELELAIVKELLLSQREMVDLDSQADGSFTNEDCSNQLRTLPALKSMENQLSPQCRSYCPQEKTNLNLSVINDDVISNDADGALANKGCSNQLRTSRDLGLTSMMDQHSSQLDCCKPQEKQYPNIATNDVGDNQGDGVLVNVSSSPQVSQKGYSDQLRSSFDFALTLMRDQQSCPPATSCPQEKQNLNFIAMGNDLCSNQGDGALANNDCSNQLLAISDFSSSEDQCPSPSLSCRPQLMQKHNIIDNSRDGNEDKSTSEDCVMKREISKLRMEINDLKKEIKQNEKKLSDAAEIEEENTKLRKDVETLTRENLLHLSAFDTVTRLSDVVFGKIADEVLGTTK